MNILKKIITALRGGTREIGEAIVDTQGTRIFAQEIAEKVAGLEAELATLTSAKNSYTTHVDKLKKLMENAEKQITDYERQLTMVKTTENVQKATVTITDNFSASNSTLVSAKESLERIRAKQQDFDDRYLAAEALESESSGANLDDKMKAAGIGEEKQNAKAILARIKARQQENNNGDDQTG